MTTPINNFPGQSQPIGAGSAAPLAGAHPDEQAKNSGTGDLFATLLALVGQPIQDAAKGVLGQAAQQIKQSSSNSFALNLGNALGLDINLASGDHDPAALLDAVRSMIGGEQAPSIQDLLGITQQLSEIAGDVIPGAQPAAQITQTVAELAKQLLGLLETGQNTGTDTVTAQLPQPVNDALSALADLLKTLPQSEIAQLPQPVKDALSALDKVLKALPQSKTAQLSQPVNDTLSALDKVLKALPQSETAQLSQPVNEALSALNNALKALPQSETAQLSQPVNDALSALNKALKALPQSEATQLPQPVNNALTALDTLLKALPQSESGDALLARLSTLVPQSTGANADADPEIANIVSALFGDKQAQKDLASVKSSSSTIALAKPEAPSEALQGAITTGAANKTNPQTNAPGTFGEQAQASHQTQSNAAAGFAAQMQLASQSDVDPTLDPLLAGQTSANAKLQTAQQLRMMTAPYQAAAQHVNVPHVAVEMMRNIRQGATRFEIQLDPPEMGRIDVKLDIDRTGNLSARMSVERPETLELLQRDARALERALAQAGLDTGKTNLEFSLKQNPFNQQNGQQDQNDPFFGGLATGTQAESESDNSTLNNIVHYRGTLSPGGVNMVA